MSKEENSVEVPVVDIPAFPSQPLGPKGELNAPFYGMTLRDYFAGQAVGGRDSEITSPFTADEIAETAYQIADAMLKARL